MVVSEPCMESSSIEKPLSNSDSGLSYAMSKWRDLTGAMGDCRSKALINVVCDGTTKSSDVGEELMPDSGE